ncbi:hypothetical protein ROZALSC1DRAFT_24344, partial [Rozella allomycis CSF55]
LGFVGGNWKTIRVLETVNTNDRFNFRRNHNFHGSSKNSPSDLTSTARLVLIFERKNAIETFEESFATQAIYDLLFTGSLENYDHITFPGVVKRSFIVPLILSKVTRLFGTVFGIKEALKERIDCFSTLMMQIHFIFYSGRLFTNTFALPFIILAYSYFLRKESLKSLPFLIFSTFVVRFDMVLIAIPLGFMMFVQTRQKKRLVGLAILYSILFIGCSVMVDSFYWRQFSWAEFDGIMFNIVKNKSSDYGTEPYYWYWLTAIPKVLHVSMIPFVIGLFESLYSHLSHKELRFILPVFPVFNVVSTIGLLRIVRLRRIGLLILFLLIAVSFGLSSIVFVAFKYNYPGGEAMKLIHNDFYHSNISLHYDVYSAQTGISLFSHQSRHWNYNKTEATLNPNELKTFDLLLRESNVNVTSYEGIGFKVWHRVTGFDGLQLDKEIQKTANFCTIIGQNCNI